MYNHEPQSYDCPFCKLVFGENTDLNTTNDIVYETDDVLAYVSPKWWINNLGHVIVIPKQHVENIYDISDELVGKVYAATKKIAIAIRSTYECTGTSTRQHNEPDGGQDVWHFHVHVFPRYKDDGLYKNHSQTKYVTSNEKQPYVEKLKEFFQHNS